MGFSEPTWFLTCLLIGLFHGDIELARFVNINQLCKLEGTTSQGGLEPG